MAKVQTMEYDMLDIIFSTRNKLYGAYFLRRLYAKNLGKSLLYALFLIGSFYAIPFLMKAANNGLIDKPIDVTIDLSEMRDIDPNTPKTPPPPKMVTPPPTRSTITHLPPVILDDKIVDEEPPQKAIDELLESKAEVGKKDLKGNDEAPPTIDKNPSELKVVETVKEAPKVDDTVYEIVEKPASFPGGEAELLRYLAKNIEYPLIARETGINGRVMMEFTVNKDGTIQDVKILKDIGGGCGKEAERVILGMPRWSPGEQNGAKVRFKARIPVFYNLQ